MEKLVKTHEMRGTRLGRLALLSPFGRDGRASASEGKEVGLGEGEGEGPVSARCLEHFEVVFFGSKPLTLFLSPSARGEATKRSRVGICGARFYEK
jgi:hypothetical protein